MPTNFPTSVDNFTNPTANDSLNLPSHSTQHANANDAIEAVEDYLLNGAGKTGLVHINTTTFTGQSFVQLNNVFTSTYENYRFVIKGTSSSSSSLYARFSAGGTANTSSVYNYSGIRSYANTVNGNIWGNSQSEITLSGLGAGRYYSATGDVTSPQTADTTNLNYLTFIFSGTEYQFNTGMGMHNTTTQFDGIRFLPSTGTLDGTVSIYGYRKS
jgi:hypothetical protein